LSGYSPASRVDSPDRQLSTGSRVNVARRRPLDLPVLPVPPKPEPAEAGSPEDAEASTFDVPAFLRRHGG
jgi:hypothetical protein